MEENRTKQLKRMKVASSVGLYGSVAMVCATAAWNYLSKYTVTGVSPTLARTMLISGTVIAVLAAVVALLTIRRYTPKLRQLDDIDEKLRLYANNICNLYYMVFAIVVAECALEIISGNTILIMVTVLLVMLLFLAYPNMYKLKVDLGLDDDTMTALFGKKYVRDDREKEGSAIDQLKLNSQLEKESNTEIPIENPEETSREEEK